MKFLTLLLFIVSFFFSSLLSSEKPNLLLLKTYKDQNITAWVMSEKLDGIRAYWDGEQLLSRGGKVIHAPEWFLKEYPSFAIDGELWSKRSDFENISSIVRDKVPGSKWQEIKHYIFEVPNAQGDLFDRLEKVKPYESLYIKIIPQIKIKNNQAMKDFLKEVDSKGGEGIVVRDPLQPYINKRTSTALKVKSFLDTECEVVGHKKGKGKYSLVLGSVQCQLENGILFSIGSGFSDAQRKNPPSIGSIVTFKYQELTKYKKPRFPVFLRSKDSTKKRYNHNNKASEE